MSFKIKLYHKRALTDSLLFTIQFSSFQEFLVLNWSTSEEWKAALTLEPPSSFEPETSDLAIQYVKHQAIACCDLPPLNVEIISTYFPV